MYKLQDSCYKTRCAKNESDNHNDSESKALPAAAIVIDVIYANSAIERKSAAAKCIKNIHDKRK